MKSLALLASALILAWTYLRNRHDYTWIGPHGTRLYLDRLESDLYGQHRIVCPSLPELHGYQAPLLLIVDRLQRARFRCLNR